VTAVRWQRILRKLGHRVLLARNYEDQRADLMIALHARRSFDSIRRFRRSHPDAPLIVALTGTDLYRDLGQNRKAEASLEFAMRIVVLQRKALDKLRISWRKKARVIHQSVTPFKRRDWRSGIRFDVCIIGPLRPVKDPFRAALASRLLPRSSRIRVIHAGDAIAKSAEVRARKETISNPRYKWLGGVSQARVRRILSNSRLFVISSRMEGGANALGEAIVAGLPVLASRIDGSVGILGSNYPGYFEVGDTRGLARLMLRCETDAQFMKRLTDHCRSLIPLFDKSREEQAWRSLIEEFGGMSE
jgi:putative glycosyltransferase (TIGR04348 family)